MKKMLKISYYYNGVGGPNPESKSGELYFELEKGEVNHDEIRFDIVEVKENYVVLKLYLAERYEGFLQYVFDSYYPVTIDTILDGFGSTYRFELVWR